MITRLKLGDFKAFHEIDLEFKGLTLLLGPNNAGKSSLIAPARLLAQTVQSADPGLPILLDGPFGDFGTFRDMVHGNHRGRPMKIHAYCRTEYRDGYISGDVDLEFKYRTGRRELVLRETTLSSNGRHLVTVTLSSDYEKHVVTKLDGRTVPAAQRSQTTEMLRMIQFIPQMWIMSGRRARQLSFDEPEWTRLAGLERTIDDVIWSLTQTFRKIDYLSAMRQPPERTYHQTGAARTRIGANGENWAGLFVLDEAKSARAKQIVPGLTNWLRNAGLASDVRLNWLSDRHYEVMIEHPVTGEAQNLADVGQANSQVIPVLVGGLRLASGSTYLVEEPEIHLHPAAQAELGDFFVDLLDQGVASVVETHSEYLVLRLLQHVVSGRIDPSRIAFYYVAPEETGKSVRQLTVDRQGRFNEPLDGGFFPQRLEEARRLAQLRGGVAG